MEYRQANIFQSSRMNFPSRKLLDSYKFKCLIESEIQKCSGKSLSDDSMNHIFIFHKSIRIPADLIKELTAGSIIACRARNDDIDSEFERNVRTYLDIYSKMSNENRKKAIFVLISDMDLRKLILSIQKCNIDVMVIVPKKNSDMWSRTVSLLPSNNWIVDWDPIASMSSFEPATIKQEILNPAIQDLSIPISQPMKLYLSLFEMINLKKKMKTRFPTSSLECSLSVNNKPILVLRGTSLTEFKEAIENELKNIIVFEYSVSSDLSIDSDALNDYCFRNRVCLYKTRRKNMYLLVYSCENEQGKSMVIGYLNSLISRSKSPFYDEKIGRSEFIPSLNSQMMLQNELFFGMLGSY